MPGVITDWGAAIWTSLGAALAMVFGFIPKLLGFLVILLIGWLVATAIEKALTFLLRKIGFDRFSTRIGLTRLEQQMGVHMDPAGLLGRIAYWFIILIFLVPAVDALGLTTVSNLLGQVINYIPNVFVAILILFLGTLAATFVSDIIRGATASTNVGNSNLFANIAKYAIIVFVSLMALEQLQITPTIINILVGALGVATALALGLAFGLGGQETARRLLSRGEMAMSNAALQRNAQQSINQARNVAEVQPDLQSDQYRNRQYVQPDAPTIQRQPYTQTPPQTQPPYTQQ